MDVEANGVLQGTFTGIIIGSHPILIGMARKTVTGFIKTGLIRILPIQEKVITLRTQKIILKALHLGLGMDESLFLNVIRLLEDDFQIVPFPRRSPTTFPHLVGMLQISLVLMILVGF